jgi:hypothetical protein
MFAFVHHEGTEETENEENSLKLILGVLRGSVVRKNLLDHLNLTSRAALPINHLAALLGAHAGAEPDLTGTLDLAGFMRVMHCRFL